MARQPPASVDLPRLLQLLQAGDLDRAIDAGLMACDPALAGDAQTGADIAAAQRRLAQAWAARERYRARAARLAQRATEREARRAAAAAPVPGRPSALPPAAAQALARAKARAATRKP